MLFGEFLVNNSVITEVELNEALKMQKTINKRLGETLIYMGLVDRATMSRYLEIHLIDNVDNVLQDPDISGDLLST